MWINIIEKMSEFIMSKIVLNIKKKYFHLKNVMEKKEVNSFQLY